MIHKLSIAVGPSRDVAHYALSAQTREDQRLAAFASVGGIFLVAGLALVMLFEQFRSIVYLVFLFMLGIAPPLSAGLVYLGERSTFTHTKLFGTLLTVLKAFLLCLLMTLIALLLIRALMWPNAAPTWVLIAALLTSASAIAALGKIQALPLNEFSGLLDAYLIVALSIAVFILSPFNPAEPMPIGLLNYALSASHFGFWALFGVAWTAVGIWLRRHEGWAFPHRKRLLESLATLALSLVIFGLYDDGHFVDFGHYMPLVGPAMHAMRGGIPMVDVYSVYGLLPWLVHSAAFAIFEPTFGTAAILLRLINLAYFAVILSILFLVSRRRLSALWFFIPALLVAITSHNPGPAGMWNMNALPMTLGGRNLLPAGMTLLLVASPGRNWTRWTALVLIMLASLSSIEILAFTLAPWGYCLLLECVRSRSVSVLLRWGAFACAAIIVAQAAFVAAIFLSTGEVVDYRPYFSLFLQFRPAEESIWSTAFVPDYALWLPIGLSYFLIMAAASYRAFRGEIPDSFIERLLPVAIFGLGPLAYFFGRPQEGTLNIACLSFAVVAIGVAEVMFIKAWRFGSAGPVLSAIMALAFAFVIADGFEHFMRPFDPSLGNATILRRCFSEQGCRLLDVPRNINLALHTQPLDPRTKVGYLARDAKPRIEEVISMLRRLAPNARYVGMLTEHMPIVYADANGSIGLTAFMATGQWFAWSISSPLLDGDSAVITAQILKRVAATPSGLLVIISNQRESWAPLNEEILDSLRMRCRLSLVERGQYQSAFRTENCTG